MKKYILTCVAALMGVIFAQAESISVEDLLLQPGETATVGVGLTNSNTYLVSFQMDVYLPEGISVNKNGCSLTSRFSSGELTIGRQNDGSYRVTATSFTLTPITGTEGDLVNLSLTASANASAGEASIRNIRFVTSGSESVLAEDVTFTIYNIIDQSIALTELPVMTYGDGVYTLPEETEQGMPIDWSVDNSAVAKVVGNNLMIKGAGTATVTAYQEGNNRYNELEQTFTLTVNKAPLTITAQSYTIEQGEALSAFEATYEGFVNNQTVSALTTQPSFSCTAANSDVPGTYDITVSGAASQNYEISYVGGTLTITMQPAVTITANSYTMVYGDPLPTFEFISGAHDVYTISYNGSDVQSTSGYFTHSDKHNFNAKFNGATYAGISFTKGLKMESATKIYFTNTVAANVVIVQSTYSSNSITLDDAALDVNSAEAGEGNCRIYTLTNVAAGSHTIGQGNGESGVFYISVTYLGGGATPDGTPELSCEATSASPVGTYPITVSKGTVTNYNVTYVAGTLTIVKAPLTITADDCTKKQGDPLPTWTATYEGFKNDDTAEVLTHQPTFSCEATEGSAPGTYEISVSGATAQNYDITYASGTLTVTEADPVTVTATSYTIHYGDNIPKLEYTSEGATLTGTPALSCEATKTSPAGTYPITITTGSVSNYNVTYVAGTLTIEKAPLTVTAKSYTKKQGDAMPDFELTYAGFKNNETTQVLTQDPVATCEATEASAPGTYDIVVSGGEDENYEFVYVNGTLTVTEADQVIVRAKNYTIKYGEIIPTLGYTTEGASLDGTPALSCDATSSSPVGTYPISIEQGSVTNYNVTYVGGTLTIEKAPLTITAKDCTMKRGEELPEFEALYDGFKNNETAEVLTTQPTFSCDATPSSNMGTYIIGVSGAEAENYEITFVAGQLTITQADPVTVTAKNYTIEYGDELPELEYTTSGVALVGEPELFCSATPTSPVGTYPITVTQGTIENYNVAFVTGTLTIVKAELTVTAKSYTIKEGDPLPQYEALYDGFKNNETESVLSKLPTIDSMADENSPAGEYDIFVGGARAQNYKFKYVNGLLTIEARADHDCATPTITYVNGKLVYECETEGATFRSTITCEDIAEHVGNEVDLTVAYHISVVASAEGYNDSEPATATLCWIDTEPVESVATGVLEIPGTPVLLKSSNGEISVEGLANGTQVAVYTAEGMLVGSEKVADGKVVITTSLMPGTVAIVRMGNKAVKMVVR